MLIGIPLTMGYMGATFGETIVDGNDFSQQVYDIFTVEENDTETGFIGSIVSGILDSFIGSILKYVFLGYTIFPVWFNIIIIALPIILLTRAVVSVSG